MRQGAPYAPPAFGPAAAAALLSGSLLLLALPELPSFGWLLGTLPLALSIWWRGRSWRALGALLLGFCLTGLHAQHSLSQRVDPGLAGHDLAVTGKVFGLPDTRAGITRFDLRVLQAPAQAPELRGRRIRLSWYRTAPEILPGQELSLTVRLKRPRGVLNPGGFDFERRALERRLAATGYVRDGAGYELRAGHGGIDAWRQHTAARVDAAVPGAGARFVRALAVGDTRGLSERDWEILRATGLTHLVAISGFHVGMVAGFGALLALLLYRPWPGLALRLPRPQGAALLALTLALLYAGAAGFGLPTVRTVLMIAAALLARLLRRAHSSAQAFALALVVVLLVDPLAVLSAGFWLSFAGVAWLLWCLPREAASRARDGSTIAERCEKRVLVGYAQPLLAAQLVAVIGLLPLTVWFFGQASSVGPLVNLVGIPWITLGVVPLCLLGLGLSPISETLASWSFRAAAQAMEWLWLALEPLAGWHGALLWLPEPAVAVLVLAGVGAFWLLLPRAVPGKWLALLLFLPLLWPRQEPLAEGEFELAMVDVGQGSALWIRTAEHLLMYDSGPSFEGGLDLGQAAVVPALHASGVRRVDALVISHGDNDHAGGAGAIRRAFQPSRAYAPRGWRDREFIDCVAGDEWEWEGVRFRFLHPTPHFPYLRNESSCVLRIEGRHASALLPGDIGTVIEQRLLRDSPQQLRADILLVPHHGSATSSSQAFVEAVNPRWALLGVGHANRFGLPREDIVQRYRRIGSTLLDSSRDGFVALRADAQGVRLIEARRRDRRRLWRER